MPGYPPYAEPPLPRSHRRKRNSALVALAVSLAVLGVLTLTGVLFATAVLKPVTTTDAVDAPQRDHPGGGAGSSPAGPPPSAAPSSAARRPSPSPSVKPKPSPTRLTGVPLSESQVLTLVNQQRALHGCRPVTYDARLARAARAHSTDMAVHNYFDHTTPSGVAFDQRITAAGYQWSAAGENIAAGQPTPASVMDAWMNSPGHRANILNCGYRNLGVGLAYNSKHTPYWTQDFASPR